mgnify:FL=1
MTGAADARKVALETEYEKNPALLYAAVRNILLRKGKQVEIVANYEPSFIMYLSGGNSSSVRAKEKTREVFSRQPLISQQTFTPWGSLSRTAHVSCSRPF